MADFLIQMTLGNLLVAAFLAVAAWSVQKHIRSASLANLLWALVLIKLITPPLFSVGVLELPSVSSLSETSNQVTASNEVPLMTASLRGVEFPDEAIGNQTSITEADTTKPTATFAASLVRLTPYFFSLWAASSALILCLSAIRIGRFHALLRINSRDCDKRISKLSQEVAMRLCLRKSPDIMITSANIAPFVWWMRGRTVIVLSEQAISNLSHEDLRMVVMHEMAHIKRRDHWFRWLEWLALVGFWWNPLMWYARNQMRICEEMACDDLALRTLNHEIHQYANSL